MSNYENTNKENKSLPPITEGTIITSPNIFTEIHHPKVQEIQPKQSHTFATTENEEETYIAPITTDRKGQDLEPNCQNTCNNPNCICTAETCPKTPMKKPNLLDKMKHLFEK